MADTNELILYYEGIEGVINLVVNNPDCSYDDCVQAGVNSSGLSEEIIQNWMNVFINTICDYLKIDASIDNAKQWIITQSQENSKTVEQICDMLIGMIAAVWQEEQNIIIVRNNQIYRKIEKRQIDLSSPPTGIQSVHFANILINENNGKRELIINIGKWAFSLSWDKISDDYKYIYVAWLKIQNLSIPDDLQEYIMDTIDISNLYFDINLDGAVLLSEV